MKEHSLSVVFLISIIFLGCMLVGAVNFAQANEGKNGGGSGTVKDGSLGLVGSSSQLSFGTPNFNATRAGSFAQFQINVTAQAGVAGYIFYDGNANSSYTPVVGASTSLLINSTLIMPSSGYVSVEWYADDTDGFWNSSGLYTYPVYQMSSSVLAADGNRLYFNNGTSIILRGVDYTYLMDDINGSWMMPDGSVNWQTWSTAGVADFVNLCQTWKVNVVRVFLTVQFWLGADHATYYNHLAYFANQLQNAGIYVDFCFYRNNATDDEPAYLPWEDTGNGYLNSPQDFVNLWANFSATFANAPNVIFELWNEPQGPNSNDEASWFTVTQSCIDAIRAVGASNPIVVEWDEGVSYNFYAYQINPSAGIQSDMSFITQYPLDDPAGNLIYSTHIYRFNFYNSVNNYAEPYLLNDSSGFNVFQALSMTGVLSAAQNHVVWAGEIGDRLYGMPDSTTYENEWFGNTLTLLNQYSIGYAGFAAPPWTDGSGDRFGFVLDGEANYALSNSGKILVDSIAGEVYSPPASTSDVQSNSERSTSTPSPQSPSPTPSPPIQPSPNLTPSSTSPPTLGKAKASPEMLQTILTVGLAAALIAIVTIAVMKRRCVNKAFSARCRQAEAKSAR